MAQLNFDATRVAPDQGAPEAVPAGWYIAAADESENKPTKDGLNTYTKFRFTILDGPFRGRKFFNNFNLQHSNPQTSSIAAAQLSAFCHAAGVLQLQATEQLHGIPIKVKLGVKQDQGYEPSNEIKAYKNINEDVGPVGGQPGAPGTTGQSGGATGYPPAQSSVQPGGWQPPPQQPAQAPMQPQVQPGGWQQPPAQQPAQQPPAQQPWQQGAQPAAQPPVQQQPAQQPWQAPSAPQPAAQPPQAGGWQPPAGQQPWGQPQQPQASNPPVQPQQAQPQAQHPAQMAAPPWAGGPQAG